MGLMSVSPEKQAKQRRIYVEAAQPHTGGEEVLAVGPFQRTGQYFSAIPGLSQLWGLVGHLIHSRVQKGRSGNLPDNYLLVVTPTRIVALKYAMRGGGGVKIKGEVASWSRDGLRIVDQQHGTIATTLTFEASENGETAKFKANTPKLSSNPWSSEVVEVVSSGATAPAESPAPA